MNGPFVPISDRIMLFQNNSSSIKTNIIRIYADTADKSDEIKVF